MLIHKICWFTRFRRWLRELLGPGELSVVYQMPGLCYIVSRSFVRLKALNRSQIARSTLNLAQSNVSESNAERGIEF